MKKAPQTTITEREGINLIERRVLEMGHIWHPTTTVDSGIDGEIELRDPTTGEVLNVRIGVQSRATARRFAGENEKGFTYTPKQRDTNYWLAGTRTILVRSRPKSDEAYFIDVTEWASDPRRLRKGKIHFDKRRDAFDVSAADRLRQLGASAHPDIAAGTALERHESLISNLLPVTHVAPVLFSAPAAYDERHDATEALVEAGLPPRKDWTLRDRKVWSLVDLTVPGLAELCAGPVTQQPTEVWSESADRNLRHAFGHLLVCTLRQIHHRHLAWNPERRQLYFKPTRDLEPLKHKWSQGTGRTVFRAYSYRSDGELSFYRHDSCHVRFVRYAGRWFLELEPSYHFTLDGQRESLFAYDQLRKIKAVEGAGAVRDALRMWAHVFTEGVTLFGEPPLELGPPIELAADRGIVDADWSKPKPKTASADATLLEAA